MFDTSILNMDFLSFLMPEFCLTLGLLVVLVMTVLKNKKDPEEQNAIQVVAILFTVTALMLLGYNFKSVLESNPSLLSILYSTTSGEIPVGIPDAPTLFFGTLQADILSYFIRALLLLGLGVVVTFAQQFLSQRTHIVGDFYILVMGATVGGMILASANDLILLFVGLETLSITSYILAGYLRRQRESAEASFKYLIYGGAATGVFLFGLSLLYGMVGSTNLGEIAEALVSMGNADHPTVFLMLLMVLAAVAFKLSLAPFQMWTPDVYDGAPTPVAGFLSVVSKTAAFAIAIRLFAYVFFSFSIVWQPLVIFIAVASMIIGNFVALRQTHFKRLLAYSTIAHAGYMLLGLLVLSPSGISSLLYYLLAYAFMNLGAFAAVIYIENQIGTDRIDAMSGLVHKLPGMTLGLSVCLLSLAGIPITSGFFAKFFLFQSVVMAGSHYLWIVVIALLTSTVSLFYYLNPMRVMVIGEPSKESAQVNLNSELPAPLFAATVLTILLGVWASTFLNLTQVTAMQVLASNVSLETLSQNGHAPHAAVQKKARALQSQLPVEKEVATATDVSR